MDFAGRFRVALYDHGLRKMEREWLGAWRAELLAGLRGEGLEIGAGTGANLPHYPSRVQRLVALEPDPAMNRRLRHRIAALGRACGGAARPAIEPSAARSESLPFADGTFDFVVSTFVLCSVGSVEETAREVRRVLRPGGRLVFLEHVRADADSRAIAWQRRLEPVWCRLSGACHLTRDPVAAFELAGLHIERAKRGVFPSGHPLTRHGLWGTARAVEARPTGRRATTRSPAPASTAGRPRPRAAARPG